MQRVAAANDRENFHRGVTDDFNNTLLDRHARNEDILNRVYANPEMLERVRKFILVDVYERLREAS